MIVVYLAIVLWAGVVVVAACKGITAWLDRPLTDYDRRCNAIDEQLDELAARRATRPHGNCDVIRGPWDQGAA